VLKNPSTVYVPVNMQNIPNDENERLALRENVQANLTLQIINANALRKILGQTRKSWNRGRDGDCLQQ